MGTNFLWVVFIDCLLINGLLRIVKSCKADTRTSPALSAVNLNTSSLREVSYFSKRQR